MAGWSTHRGRAVHLPLDDIDTDQIIPARFMSVPRDKGYGNYLMYDLRRDEEGAMRSDFALNRASGSVLIAGRNFGSGSSREAAVYALVDAGFRAVIAPGFGDIFAGNAVNNGLLPARMAAGDVDALAAALAATGGLVTIDLESAEAVVEDRAFAFELDDTWRVKLINGWDDVDLTRQHAEEIARYRAARAAEGWTWPDDEEAGS
jgi:3-isopropylmalate/(R)-2-methylmalate dehydratase small subunit